MREKQDYWGVIHTHTDEKCIEAMRDAVREYFDDRDSIVISEENMENIWITNEVEDLLIEYAAPLFNTLPSDRDLYNEIREFVSLINLWCNNNRVKKHLRDHIDNTRPIKKKSEDERIKTLRGAVTAIKGISGESRLNQQVLDALNTIDAQAQDLANRELPFAFSGKNTGTIKQYLRDLKMPHTTDEIEKFVQELNKLK